jgi:excisionase family DNA binding protein
VDELSDEDLRIAQDFFSLAMTKTIEADGLKSLLTRRQVADLINSSTRTVGRMESDGRLPAVHVGPRTPRYRASDVAALIKK